MPSHPLWSLPPEGHPDPRYSYQMRFHLFGPSAHPLIASFPVLETLLRSTQCPGQTQMTETLGPHLSLISNPLEGFSPWYSFGAPQMNAKLGGGSDLGTSPPPSGRVCAAPPGRPPASLPEPSAACVLHWSALSLERQGCPGLQGDKRHLLRNAEARHP